MPDLSIRFLYSYQLNSVNNPAIVTDANGAFIPLGQVVFTQPDPYSAAKGGETVANNLFNLNGSNDVGGTLTLGGVTYTGAVTTVDQPTDRDAFGFLATTGEYFLLVTANSVRNYGNYNGTGVSVITTYSSNSSPQKLDALNALLGEQPVIANDQFTVDEGAVIAGNIATNDSIVSGTRNVYSVNGSEWSKLAASSDATYTAADGYRQLVLTNGTLYIKQDGTTAYRHNGSETTSDSYTYILSDSVNVSAVIGSVGITVNPVNDAPVAVANSLTVAEGGTVNGNILTNDTDAENSTLSVGKVNGTAWASLAASTDGTYTAAAGYKQVSSTNGTLFIKSDGTTAYRHNGSETLSDSFTYTASDGTVESNTVTTSITVTPVNDAPIAVDDSPTVLEGATITGNLLTNDTDAEGSILEVHDINDVHIDTLALSTNSTYSAAAGYHQKALANGILYVKHDGQYAYVHDGSETVSDSFSYTTTDGSLTSNTGNVSITVTPQNDPPVLNLNGTANVGDEIRYQTINITQTIVPVAFAASATTNLADIDTNAFTSLTIKIAASEVKDGNSEKILIGSGAGAPEILLAQANGTTSTFTYGGVEYKVTFNDVSISSISYKSITISDNSGGSIAKTDLEALIDALYYTNVDASIDTSVRRTFQLNATDESGAVSNPTSLVVSLTSTAAPVIDLVTTGDAIDRTVTFTEGGPAVGATDGAPLNLTPNDPATEYTQLGIGFNPTLFGDGAHEKITIAGADNETSISLDAAANTTGSFTLSGVSYQYKVLHVTDNLHRIIFTKQGGGTFTPEQAEALLDSYRYLNSSDNPTTNNRIFTLGANSVAGGANLPTKWTVQIDPVNDAPTGVPDAVMVANAGEVKRNVLLNDTDVEFQSLTVASVNGTDWAALINSTSADYPTADGYKQVALANGTLYIVPNGEFTYIHDGSATTSDSFSYTATDGTVSSGSTAVTIAVLGALDMTDATDSGTSQSDEVTKNGNPVLVFKGGADLVITLEGPGGAALTEGDHFSAVYDPGTRTYTVTLLDADPAANDGNSASDAFGDYKDGTATGNSSNTGDGVYTIKASDGSSTATVGTFEIDTTPPSTPTVDALVTSNTEPTLTGTASVPEGGKLEVTVNGATYLVTPDENGDWSLDLANATPASGSLGTLEDGQTYSVTATITDAAGNSISDVTSSELSIDTGIVVGPLDMTDATDSGASQSDELTSADYPVLTFTGEPGLTLSLKGADGSTLLTHGKHFDWIYDEVSGTYTVTLLDADIGDVAGDPFGTYSGGALTGNIAATADGTYTLLASDSAGNSATIGTFVIDTTPPAAPTVDSLFTSDTTPTLTGTANVPAGGSLRITVSGATYSITPAQNGSWSLNLETAEPVIGLLSPLVDGQSYDVTAIIIDAAGNSTLDVTSTELAIDSNLVVGNFDMTDATDRGASQSDELTNNGNPVLTFTGEAGLTISLKGPNGTSLTRGTHFDWAYANGTYTVTLLDAKSGGSASDPFGTYSGSALTNNPAATADGTYTLLASDQAGNSGTVGTFEIDTTPPSTGPINLTDETDTGADDTVTSNGNPIIKFTGAAGLKISLLGAEGDALTEDQFDWSYDELTQTYTVSLLDANPSDPTAVLFGDYDIDGEATGNLGTNTGDGTYTIKATELSGNSSTVGTFEIDTAPPVITDYDMVDTRDLGVSANDELTSHPFPALTFKSDESGLSVELYGPDGSLLQLGQHYTVSNSGTSYSVLLRDAKLPDAALDPFGTYSQGTPTNNQPGSADGEYKLVAVDLGTGARSDVGMFRIDTTRPDVEVIDGSIDISEDTGVSDSDFITRVANQTVMATLSRTLNTGERLLGSADGGRTWVNVTAKVTGVSISWDGVTLDRSSSIRFKVSDDAGNDGVERSQAYTLDTTAPGNKVVSIRISDDTGVSGTDFITSKAEQTVTARLVSPIGTGDILYASRDGGATWIDITGSVLGRSIDWRGVTLVDGLSSLRFKIGDAAGNEGETTTQAYQLVADTPAATISNIDISIDTGISDSDFITNSRTQTITADLTGTLGQGDRVMGSLDGGQTWRDVTSFLSGQKISWAAATLLSGSGRSIVFKIENSAGTIGSQASQAYELDASRPLSRVTIDSISVDNGPRSNDFVTSVATQNISATLSAPIADGERVMGSIDGGKTWQAIPALDISGTAITWRGVSLLAGSNSVMLRVEDIAGNLGTNATRIVTIQNRVTLAAVSAIKLEGDTAGPTPYTFAVELLSPELTARTFNWTVSPYGRYGATAADFGDGTSATFPSGTVTIAPGQTKAEISVPVHVDQIWDQDQGFSVRISIATGAPGVVVDGSGVAYGTILNDDDLLGTAAGELLTGSDSSERIDGLDGSDRIRGQGGGDVINGGAGRDQLTGGAGADTFEFSAIADSSTRTPDIVTDFNYSDGDRIDLSKIDAIVGGADNAFSYSSTGLGGGAGKIAVKTISPGSYLLEGDVNGDAIPDFAVSILSTTLPEAGWFIV